MESVAVFVITLRRDQDRVNNVAKNVISALPECEIFSAIDGQSLNISEACAEYSIPQEFFKKPGAKGNLGCALSHFHLLKMVVERKYEKVIIFEDDIKVPEDFRNKLSLVLDEVPDNFDFLYLWVHPKYRHQDDSNFLVPGKSYVRKYSYTYGTSAYLVTFEGAKKIVKYFSRSVYDYVDFMVSDLIASGGLTTYMTRNSLVDNLGQLTAIEDGEILKSNIRPQSFRSKVSRFLLRISRKLFKSIT